MKLPYKISRANVSTSTAITVIQVKVPATCEIEIVRFEATTAAIVDLQARIQLLVKTAAATVTSATPQPLSTSSSAPASLCVGGTAATGISASAEGTDGAVLWEEQENQRVGALYLPIPEERIIVAPSTIIGVKFPASQTAANWNMELSWLECY